MPEKSSESLYNLQSLTFTIAWSYKPHYIPAKQFNTTLKKLVTSLNLQRNTCIIYNQEKLAVTALAFRSNTFIIES